MPTWMPIWMQWIIGVSILIGAIAVIWKKFLHPAAKLVTTMDEALPIMRELTFAFRGTPHAFEVLDEIVAQFRTDHGSSLRDVVNKLEKAAHDNQFLLGELTVRVNDVVNTSLRIERAAGDVADDLAESHKRAESAVGGPGAGADAAAQQTEKEKLKSTE